MQPIKNHRRWNLHNSQSTRQWELAAQAALMPNELMKRAGLACAQLALALAPHSKTIWVACGPGNNGADGLIAALHLKQFGKQVRITRFPNRPGTEPSPETAWALQQANIHSIEFRTSPPEQSNLIIDAIFGLAGRADKLSQWQPWIDEMHGRNTPMLAIDLPSGLNPNTGQWQGPKLNPHQKKHTLSLLSLKPGLFSLHGRDAAGEIWLDDLNATQWQTESNAELIGPMPPPARNHDSHKGQFGHVWVIGGDQGMSGAAWLAGQSALRRGAGRVHVQLLAPEVSPLPHLLALMTAQELPVDMSDLTVVAGCGGGRAIAQALPRLLSTAPRLVLDADALNAIAADGGLQTLLRHRAARQRLTVLTPHPLEAARLLKLSTSEVQADRLNAARRLAQEMACVVVLKGSGSLVADPTGRLGINPTGNHRLATAGSGDVLAGWIGARLAQGDNPWTAACAAVYLHGLQAELASGDGPLVADQQ